MQNIVSRKTYLKSSFLYILKTICHFLAYWRLQQSIFYHVYFKSKEMRLVAKFNLNHNTVSVLSSVTDKTGLAREQYVIAVDVLWIQPRKIRLALSKQPSIWREVLSRKPISQTQGPEILTGKDPWLEMLFRVLK